MFCFFSPLQSIGRPSLDYCQIEERPGVPFHNGIGVLGFYQKWFLLPKIIVGFFNLVVVFALRKISLIRGGPTVGLMMWVESSKPTWVPYDSYGAYLDIPSLLAMHQVTCFGTYNQPNVKHVINQ